MLAKIKINKKEKTVVYQIFDILPNLTKANLIEMSRWVGENATIITNSGVDLHSSEVDNNKWNGITIKRLK